jgi:hypothetical protein
MQSTSSEFQSHFDIRISERWASTSISVLRTWEYVSGMTCNVRRAARASQPHDAGSAFARQLG